MNVDILSLFHALHSVYEGFHAIHEANQWKLGIDEITRHNKKINYLYDGQILNNLAHGKGILMIKDSFSHIVPRYLINFPGTPVPDGFFRIYEGGFYKGMLHGSGYLTLPTGDSYGGEFRNSYFHGEGTFSFSDGRVLFGSWNKGIFIS